MSWIKESIRWVAPGLIGAASAVLLAPVVGADKVSHDAPPAAERERPGAAGSPGVVQTIVRRGPVFRPRAGVDLDALDDPSADEEEDPLALEPELFSPEVEYELVMEGRDQHAQRWNSETVDASWAGGAEADLRGELESVATKLQASDIDGFKVADIECRSTTCVAKLEWGSAEQAVDHGERIAMANYGEACGVFVPGPSPEARHSDSAFEQEVYFNCG